MAKWQWLFFWRRFRPRARNRKPSSTPSSAAVSRAHQRSAPSSVQAAVSGMSDAPHSKTVGDDEAAPRGKEELVDVSSSVEELAMDSFVSQSVVPEPPVRSDDGQLLPPHAFMTPSSSDSTVPFVSPTSVNEEGSHVYPKPPDVHDASLASLGYLSSLICHSTADHSFPANDATRPPTPPLTPTPVYRYTDMLQESPFRPVSLVTTASDRLVVAHRAVFTRSDSDFGPFPLPVSYSDPFTIETLSDDLADTPRPMSMSSYDTSASSPFHRSMTPSPSSCYAPTQADPDSPVLPSSVSVPKPGSPLSARSTIPENPSALPASSTNDSSRFRSRLPIPTKRSMSQLPRLSSTSLDMLISPPSQSHARTKSSARTGLGLSNSHLSNRGEPPRAQYASDSALSSERLASPTIAKNSTHKTVRYR